ncbi:MAG: phage holin family protein [Deltaproteobacteria bacterium]|nr:phage holin family protein [Deltaproteobacteria bacterium]MCB9788941.1 phage holin family protein [Deltaproteobacteria bacterium]
MIPFLVHMLTTAALLLLVAHLVRGVHIAGWGAAFIGALALGLVNALVRPLMVLLTFPLTLLTLGLFLLVVNALMLWLTSAIVPGIRIDSFAPAFWGSLLLSILNTLISLVFGLT